MQSVYTQLAQQQKQQQQQEQRTHQYILLNHDHNQSQIQQRPVVKVIENCHHKSFINNVNVKSSSPQSLKTTVNVTQTFQSNQTSCVRTDPSFSSFLYFILLELKINILIRVGSVSRLLSKFKALI